MSTNDQYFQPGDKVMLVQEMLEPQWEECPNTEVRYGEVYCVSAFWSAGGYNMIDLVGTPPAFDDYGRRCGYLAMEFRKVDEIKLCVAAAQLSKATVCPPTT